MTDWFREWATSVIAFVALVQPWVIALLRRWLRRGSISIYETGLIEISYGSLGPTIGLHGTLRAQDRDFFIRSAHLDLVKQSDRSQHRFQWLALRSARVTVGRLDEMTLEIPAGFMLLTSQPHRYNIVFGDTARQEQIRPILEGLRLAWSQWLWNRLGAAVQTTADPTALEQLRHEAYAGYRAEFVREQVHVEAYTAIDRMSYWEPGRYEMTLVVNTTQPDRSFSHRWEFELSAADVANLRLNVVVALEEVCTQQTVRYNFAMARYL